MQELSLLSKIVENEVQRQISLNQIKNELRKRGIRRLNVKPIDVTDYLKDTKNNILRVLIAKGGSVFALVLPKFSGLLKRELFTGKTLGRELADIAFAFGVNGIFHSDEDLTKYNLVGDFQKLRNLLKAREEDAIILVGESRDKGKVANQLSLRCSKLLEEMDEETRSILEDGSTRYNRPLPGSARLYVETDLLPVPITKEFLDKIKKQLPEPWDKKLTRLKKMNLSEQLAKQILTSEHLEIFEEIMKTKKVEASVVANTFTSTLKDLIKREKVDVRYLNKNHFLDLFENIENKKIVKEAIPEVLKYLATKPGDNVSSAIKELGLQPISLTELKKIVKEIISQPGLNYDKAVGIVMSKVRGRIDAQTVIKVVKQML
jgi:glutamyl-tRNA(Gln) amidotransferase subunit E